MFQRVLVPLDGSELAEAVLPYVEDLAKRLKNEVYFVQIAGMPLGFTAASAGGGVLLGPELIAEQMEADVKEAERYLSSLAGAWRAKGIAAQWQVLSETIESPALGIIDFAREHGIDLIAMSTHGRSGLSRLVAGSVAERVMREGVAPVLLIRPVKKEKRA